MTGEESGRPVAGAGEAHRQTALRQAIELVHVPTLAHRLRGEPLAPGVDLLLAIAAGDRQAEAEAQALVERDVDTIRQASAFYIQQVLFAPGTDAYRILGATPRADRAELRRNFTHLMRWLHPDIERDGGQAVFFGRVKAAWDILGTPERRRRYDAEREAGGRRSLEGLAPSRSAKSGRFSKRARRRADSPIRMAKDAPGRSARAGFSKRERERPRPLLLRALARLFGFAR